MYSISYASTTQTVHLWGCLVELSDSSDLSIIAIAVDNCDDSMQSYYWDILDLYMLCK